MRSRPSAQQLGLLEKAGHPTCCPSTAGLQATGECVSGCGSQGCLLAALRAHLLEGAFGGKTCDCLAVPMSALGNCNGAPWYRRDAGRCNGVAFCVWIDYSFPMRVDAMTRSSMQEQQTDEGDAACLGDCD